MNSQLRLLIRSAEFPFGSKFLTERQVTNRFGVSRSTANKALSNLVSEGLLEFRRGVGTFVRGRALDYNLMALVSFTDKALTAGKQPSTEVLRFQSLETKDILDDVPMLLQASPDTGLYYVERLRLADRLRGLRVRSYHRRLWTDAR